MALATLLAEAAGPLTPVVRAEDPSSEAAVAGEPQFPNGRVVETAPAPITTPAGGAGPSVDPTIGGEPMFVPYTPPAEVSELADERTAQSRTLANPDGTFILEMSEGPVNFLDAEGNWQPLNLALVPEKDGGYRVAATAGSITLDTSANELGVIEIDGHRVALSSPGYASAGLGADLAGSELDANTVTFTDALETAADVWVRPVDIGLEFGATWPDATKSPVVSFVLEADGLVPAIGKDGRSVVLTDEKGEFAGAISAPIVREGSEDGPPLFDIAAVALVRLAEGGHLLSYTLDPKWLAASERVFPIILDPVWCMGKGASGCDDNFAGGNNYDTFVYSASPDSYETGWTVLRTGYDVRSDDGGSYGTMRTLLQFGHPALPDGAVVYDTDLQLKMCCKYGSAQGQTIYARRITKWWEPPYTWNQFNSAATTVGEAAATVPASGAMNWDVDAIVQSWYTRTNGNRKPDFGFVLRMANEGSAYGEVEFRRYNYGTAADRPLLRIWFTQPKVGIDFDDRLGPAYAPSNMVAGSEVKLPIKVENKTGSAHTLDRCTGDDNCWKVGYRWFDEKGNPVSLPGGTVTTFDLPEDVTVNDKSNAFFPITVTSPSTVGQYTLRLDLVHEYYGRLAWASDYAEAAKFYSRNKKLLTASSTRWTGSSAIERAEFSVNVGWGVGGGHVQTVPVASGGTVGIDLASKNLSVHADTGLGFADRLPMSLTYGYNETLAELCAGYLGILGACGWFTNWDERITGGSNQTGFDYTYVDPSGTPYMLDTNGSGQLVGGAPVLINRPRVTVIDENGGWDGGDAGTAPDVQAVLASGEGSPNTAFSGSYIGKAPAGSHTGFNLPDKINLSTYRKARFAIRSTISTGPLSSGLCFQIHNLSDPDNFPDKWFCATVGSAWNTGHEEVDLGLEAGKASLRGIWNYYYVDLYESVRTNGAFGGQRDDYQVIKIQLQSAGSNANSVYIDGFRFEALDTVLLDETNPSWTSGSSTENSTDSFVSAKSIEVTPASGFTPSCHATDGCFSSSNPGLWAYSYADWYWKKIGGTSAAMTFWIHNTRSGGPCYSADCKVVYYAGSAPNVTADATIRISATLPTTWTLVRRNLLEDARQALNLYDDTKGGAADEITLKGFAPLAVDGARLLVDRLAYGNLADSSGIDPTGPDPTGALGQQYHPGSVGSTTFTYDFSADYPDGSRHYFNRDGLLLRIRDRDRQAITLDWTFDAAKAGPSAYTLTAIHAPTDGTSAGGTTFNRQFTIVRADAGSVINIRFDEDLGSTGSDSSGRAAVFVVEDDSAPDLLAVSPARKQPAIASGASGTFCGSRPNGCVEYAYDDSTNHRLRYIIDPRWDGSTGSAADYRLEVGRSGTDPVSIKDASHGGATLLKLVPFTDPSNALYRRVIWQDAPAAAANAATAADLTPDGRTLTQYLTKDCSGASCATPPTWDDSYKAVDYQFDGLAQVTTVKTYRCPVDTGAISGCTGGERVTMTRSETTAGAKIDNYADPLAGGRLAWRADADQVFASLKDSNGTNADWYRTEFIYDGAGQIAETIEVRQLEASNYAETVKLLSPYGYWRLNDTTAATMADAAGSRNGSYPTSPTLQQAGALLRDATNKAPAFNGTSQYGSVAGSAGNTLTGSFSVSSWILSTDESIGSQTFVGSRGSSDFGFDAKLCSSTCSGGEGIRLDVGNGSGWLGTGTVPFDWEAGRWYHVVVVVDDGKDRATVYVDGQSIGGFAFTTAGTPVLMNATHSLHIGQTGLSSSREWFKGRIDEVAVFNTAIGPWDVAAQFRAGRGVATVDSTVIRDNAGRALETSTLFTVNPGFEQSTNGWTVGAGASVSSVHFNSGSGGLFLSNNPTTQVMQLAPGQTFRLQFATKSSAGTTPVHVMLEYWSTTGTPAWTTLSGGVDTDYFDTTFQDHAYDVTLPMNTDGRIKLSLTETGAGTGWIDDVLVVTAWGAVAYDLALPVGARYGLPTDRLGLSTCPVGPCSTATLQTHLDYAAKTASAPYHPAIFPTTTIARYDDGVQGPGADEDVTTTAAYDSWGRVLVATDPDGVTATTVFAANQTDVGQTLDGLGNATSYAYDLVGNAISTTTPLGRVGSATFDARNHQLTATGPDGTVSRTDYDNYGRVAASWANYVDGVVGTDSTDDLLTVPTYDRFGHVIATTAECGQLACSSGLRAKSTTTFDLLGNTVAKTVYPGSNGSGTARITVTHFETFVPPAGTPFDPPSTTITFSRTVATGTQLPIFPTDSAAPLCPAQASQRCSSVATVDLSGRVTLATDAYGTKTRSRYDLADRPVEVIANYVDGSPGTGTAADDLVSTTIYDILGNPVVSWDPVNRRDERTYDKLGRLLVAEHLDDTGAEFLRESTEYTPAGRVERTFDGSAWTKTLYDAAGRATTTIANFDPGGGAGMTIAAFEGDPTQVDPDGARPWGWRSDATTLVTAGATLHADAGADGNTYDAVAAASGRGRLRITGSTPDSGAWLDLSGPLYQQGHTYKATFEVRTSTATSLTAYLGEDTGGGSAGLFTFSGSTGWQRQTVSWTPGTSVDQDVHFALRNEDGGTAQIYIDNLVVWDTYVDATPKEWAQSGIVSSVSGYNADGEIIASVLPPGDPTTEPPLVTAVALDPAGRAVSSVVNGVSGTYAAAVGNTANLVAYAPLDERVPLVGTGPEVDDRNGTNLAITGAATLGLAGGIDEARTAARFAGGRVSRNTNATTSTSNVSIEAWIRTDATNPAQTLVIAANGTQANGWGIGIDTAGNAAGFAILNSTLTTMSSSKKINDGQWHYVVVSRNATTWKLTVDEQEYTPSNSTTSPGTPGSGLSIGSLLDGSRAFTGEVDEVAVYTTNLAGGTASAHFAAGRQADVVSALTARTAFDRLGRTTDAWTPDLVRSRYAYDRLGNLTQTIANWVDGTPTDGAAEDDDVTSTFAYDVLGELIGYCPAEEVQEGDCTASDGNEVQAWRYVWDAMGRQVKTIPPVNQYLTALTTEETVYEPGGRIERACRYTTGTPGCGNYDSRQTKFFYDALGRITKQESWNRGVSPGTDTRAFTKLLTWNRDGSPATVAEGPNDGSSPTSSFNYLYDDAGRVEEFKTGSTVLTAYTYELGTSNVATRTDGSLTTDFEYDWARRVVTVDPDNTFATGEVSRTYRLDGLLATQSFPSSITETLGYDAAKRPVSISLGAAGSLGQTFDRSGNVLSDSRSFSGISGDAGTGTQDFEYDALSRLVESSGLTGSSGAYEYDLDNNRVKRDDGTTVTTFTYDRADQLYQQSTGGAPATFAYDRYGNLTTSYDAAGAATTYTRDAASRLTGITPAAGGAVTFGLDALDRHTTRSIGGTLADTYAYTDATETAWAAGAGTTSLLDVDGTRLAVKTGTELRWLVFDLHGSVVALADTTGSLTDAYRFNGWGEQVAAYPASGAETNPWRYRGLLNIGPDAEDGALLDMAARDYAPHLGTFTQEDSYQGSAANPASMNRFLYAHANPATLIDPDGHMAMSADSYVAPAFSAPHGAESLSTGSTTYVRRDSYVKRTWTPSSRSDRDDWETNYTAPIDCGFERLLCRNDALAGELGMAWGLVKSGWDFGAGLAALPGAMWEDQKCSWSPECLRARSEASQVAWDWLLEDPEARFDQILGAGLTGAADWIGSERAAMTNPQSAFLRGEAMAHFFGSVEILGLSTIAGPASNLRGSASLPADLRIYAAAGRADRAAESGVLNPGRSGLIFATDRQYGFGNLAQSNLAISGHGERVAGYWRVPASYSRLFQYRGRVEPIQLWEGGGTEWTWAGTIPYDELGPLVEIPWAAGR